MANAAELDEHEPSERLPRFPLGGYLATVDSVVYIDPDEDENAKHEYLIVEFTVNESEGDKALDVGKRAKVMEQFDVEYPKYPTERAKELTYALLGRRKIPGSELLDIWKSDALVGKQVRIKVVEQKDKKGNVKLNRETGEPYTENVYSEP